VPQEEGIYALKVQGTSMIDALITDGDVVVMRHTNTANNGDMIAAWLTDREETTLKRFFQEGDRVRLQPENQTMDPIYVDADKVQVQGRVVTVIRQLN
jgi:repressor LexA